MDNWVPVRIIHNNNKKHFCFLVMSELTDCWDRFSNATKEVQSWVTPVPLLLTCSEQKTFRTDEIQFSLLDRSTCNTIFYQWKHNCFGLFIHWRLHYSILWENVTCYGPVFSDSRLCKSIWKNCLYWGICLQECCFPWEFFFLSWQVRQESMLSFNICHHTQPKNHIHFFSCPAVSLLWSYSENTVNCTAELLFTANILQHLNLEIHWALV